MIARDIAERHGCTLVLDSAHSPGARFVVTLPIDGHLPEKPGGAKPDERSD